MEWTGEGLIIGVRRHGETSVIVEAMTPDRGRHLGLVRGGRSRKLAATLQPGNQVQLHWRARLDEHLGMFSIELLKARAADLIADRARLYGAQLLCAHLRLLPERDPHERLYNMAADILDTGLELVELAQMISIFEFTLLDELGFGLDISSCAVTGKTENLSHVSPRSGRAVTAEAGAKYLDKLLALPAYFKTLENAPAAKVHEGLCLTGHFLAMHVWSPRQIEPPTTRDQLVASVAELV